MSLESTRALGTPEAYMHSGTLGLMERFTRESPGVKRRLWARGEKV